MQEAVLQEVVIFMIGGTIGMRSSPLGAVPADNLEASLKSALTMGNVSLRFVAWSSKPSPHVTPEDMVALAQDIENELAQNSVHGAIVLHGTDLLAETAFVLDRTLVSVKPVVCSGSMRHTEEDGYDGIRNVVNSVSACLAMPQSSEVLVQMADCLYLASDAIKFDSVSVASMRGMLRGVVGRVVDGKTFFTQPITVKRPRLPFTVTGITSRVPLISCYPGISCEDILWPCLPFLSGTAYGPETITPSLEIQETGAQGACPCAGKKTALESLLARVDASAFLPDGVVLEGFGAGNVPPGILELVDYWLDNDVPVVLASRSPLGGVMPLYGYSGGGGELLSKGVISAKTLSAVKAQLLLKMAVASQCPKNLIQAIFV